LPLRVDLGQPATALSAKQGRNILGSTGEVTVGTGAGGKAFRAGSLPVSGRCDSGSNVTQNLSHFK